MGKREEIRRRRQQIKRKQRLTFVLIISGIALIFLALVVVPTIIRERTPLGEYVIPETVSHPMASANSMGDPNAPVVIEEFSDFGCGHCADFATSTGKQLIEEYIATGKVYFVYHSVGGLIGSSITPIAAEAAYCAGDQNKFWEFHDFIFANQRLLFANPNTDIAKYMTAFAEELNLKMEDFQSCFEGRKYRNQVAQDEANARKAGVEGTPSFLVNGELVVGAQPIDTFRQIIEEKLAQTN